MSDANKDVTLSLKVVINKEKKKVLFAEADNHFADILLSFLTLPLGRIVKVLEKHYGEEAPTIGSLSSLHHSLDNLDRGYFVSKGAKQTLLDPTSSFEDEYKELKMDISDSPPAEYFCCRSKAHNRFRSVSMYYDRPLWCQFCGQFSMRGERVVEKRSDESTCSGLVFTNHKASLAHYR